jgi:hypothetical protein
MKRTTLIATLAIASLSGAAAFAGTGLAGDISVETEPFVSTKSRAEVRAELDAFRKSGVNPWADEYNQLAGFTSSKARAEVSAEYVSNRDAVAALNGEDSGSRYLADLNAREHQAHRLAAKRGEQTSSR